MNYKIKGDNMKKKQVFLIVLLVILIIGGGIFWTKSINGVEKTKETAEVSSNDSFENYEDLTNIEECTEEFMENYFKRTEELNEKNNKENMLIVTSKNKIENVYGATDIVEAPNNQYILQYNSGDEKNKALEELKKDKDIIAEENMVHTFVGFNSWGVEKTGLNYATQIANNKLLEKITVAIIDTGCDMDLFNKSYSGKIVETYNEMNSSSSIYDNLGHGTHIAGTIAESTPDNVNILPVKVSDSKKIYTDDIVRAINYITYNKKADVINMSYCSYKNVTAEEVAIKAANEANIICVAAAGNDNTSSKAYPAALDTTLSISAVNSKLEKAYFSNFGSTITFSAPGDSIRSINGVMSGTSMAAPHAASAVAILKSYNKNLTLENIIDLLKRHAVDLGEEGYDEYYGYGFINFNGAEFYDGRDGDEFNVFKIKSENKDTILKIEPSDEVYIPIYNYGNITNLMNAKFDFYYTENDYSTKKLSEMNDSIIEGYNPFSYTIQDVKIKYNNIEISLTVDNRNARKNGWEYKYDSNSNVIITKFNYNNDEGYPTKIYIPDLLDGQKVITIGESLFENLENLESVFLTENITTIENKAFYGDENLYGLRLLDGLEKIGKMAFGKCTNLEKILIPESVKDISFSNGETGDNPFYGCNNITIWVHKDSDAEVAAKKENIDYKSVTVSVGGKLGYKPFQTVDKDNVSALIRYSDGRDEEIIHEGLKIRYNNKNTSFRGDDTYYTVSMYDKEGLYIEKKVGVFIEKLTPEYEIPTDLEAIEGMQLSEVKLPKCFEWMDEKKIIENKNGYGNVSYKAKYIPEDIVDYKIVKEIQIPIKIVSIVGYSITTPKKEYKAFEQVDEKLSQVSIQYNNSKETMETIKDGIAIKYPNGNTSFRYGDTYYIVSWYNRYGQYMEGKVENITVAKVEPTYIIPSDLEAKEGQKLSEIELPKGFKWMNENQVIEYSENAVYKARYIPEDEINYEIVENIEIPIKVKSKPAIIYETHVQDIGWQGEKQNGETAGTEGKSKRLEAIKINSDNLPEGIKIKYKTHVQDIGWQEWKYNGEISGTEGQSKRLEAIKIELEETEEYSIMYRVHVQDIGWQEWKYDGETAGTEGQSKRLEAIEIKIVEKNAKVLMHLDEAENGKIYYKNEKINVRGWKMANVSNTRVIAYLDGNVLDENIIKYAERPDVITGVNGYGNAMQNPTPQYSFEIDMTQLTSGQHTIEIDTIDKNGKVIGYIISKITYDTTFHVSYSAHVQDVGWQGYRIDGETVGTEGKSLRVEALKINLINAPKNAKIRYKTHVQDIGWQGWKYDNELSGTEGQAKRLEAMQIELENTDEYSIKYRVHVQDIGWQEWKYDGDVAGTIGKGLRLEAIEIMIVKK